MISAFEAHSTKKHPRGYGQGRVPRGGDPTGERGRSSLPLQGEESILGTSTNIQVPPVCLERSLGGGDTGVRPKG